LNKVPLAVLVLTTKDLNCSIAEADAKPETNKALLANKLAIHFFEPRIIFFFISFFSITRRFFKHRYCYAFAKHFAHMLK